MSKDDYYFRSTCRMCNAGSLEKFLELTPTPPGNRPLKETELNRVEATYPLELYHCSQCKHIQLGHIVDPRILYQKNYTYVSGTSKHFTQHLEVYANTVVDKFQLEPSDLVLDIGSNDGTCLKFFKSLGMKVLGVDPASNIALKATNSGIETISDFFSYALATQIKKKHGSVKFITSHNACAHIDQLDDIIRGVGHLLADDGVFSLEVGYFLDVYQNVWFDTIYHEHLDYHTVGPFEYLFSRLGMEIISAERISPQGGSIRVMAQKKGGKYKRDNSVDQLVKVEQEVGLHKLETFESFGAHILQVKKQLHQLLSQLKQQGKSIAGYGAPTKSTTLLMHFQLGCDFLDFIVDDNPLKQGLFTPGTHIPIYSVEMLFEQQPDYVLILAWNFADPIMRANAKFTEKGGRFIVPMPVPQIVE